MDNLSKMIIIYDNVSKHGQEIVYVYFKLLNSFYIVLDRYVIEKRE